MKFLVILPAFLSIIITSAHFLRTGQLFVCAIIVLIAFTAFIPKILAKRLVQITLLLGAIVWIFTAAELIEFRKSIDEPWLRLAVILGFVSLLNIVSIFLLETKVAKKYFI